MVSSLSSTKQISNGVMTSAAVTLLDQGPDVVSLVARGNDEADDWRAAARPFGSHRQRIGVKR